MIISRPALFRVASAAEETPHQICFVIVVDDRGHQLDLASSAESTLEAEQYRNHTLTSGKAHRARLFVSPRFTV